MNMPNADRNGAVIESIENADVTWEKNNNLNLGVEFRLFNKLSGTVEWYDRMTDDMLLVYPLPISLASPVTIQISEALTTMALTLRSEEISSTPMIFIGMPL